MNDTEWIAVLFIAVGIVASAYGLAAL